MEAHEIMKREIAALDPHASLLDVSNLMRERDVRHIPVLEGGQVVGIVSDRDVRCYLSELFRSEPETTPAAARKTLTLRQVMQTKPVTVDSSTDIRDIIDLMLEYKIGAVVVTDTEGHMRGIVSYEDILRGVRDQEMV